MPSSAAISSRRAAAGWSGQRFRRAIRPAPSSIASDEAPGEYVATSTSLNLRALLKTAIARSGLDVPARVVSGLTPAAKALFVASAAQARPHSAVLYVVPQDGDLEQACADVTF